MLCHVANEFSWKLIITHYKINNTEFNIMMAIIEIMMKRIWIVECRYYWELSLITAPISLPATCTHLCWTTSQGNFESHGHCQQCFQRYARRVLAACVARRCPSLLCRDSIKFASNDYYGALQLTVENGYPADRDLIGPKRSKKHFNCHCCITPTKIRQSTSESEEKFEDVARRRSFKDDEKRKVWRLVKSLPSRFRPDMAKQCSNLLP